MSVSGATIELLTLDATMGRGRDTLVEVAKALTVAQLHGGVEAKVMCRNLKQMLESHTLLSGKSAESLGVKWNEAEEVYELRNGSAISVQFEVPS